MRPTYPPPTEPPLAPPTAGRRDLGSARAAGAPVDWWGMQARVRAGAPAAARSLSSAHRVGARRRLPAVVLGVLVTAGIVVTAVGGVVFGGRPAGTSASGPGTPVAERAVDAGEPIELAGLGDLPAPPAPAPPPDPAPALSPPAPRGPFPVAEVQVDFVDPSRPTPPRGGDDGRDERVLSTVIRFPDVRSAGPFPLVVFAHGYATRTAAYAALLDDVAAAGYVVAAPEFPLTSTAVPGPVGARDAAEQVRDVSFVISSVLGLAQEVGPLRGVVRDGPVGVIGHSDGGITAAAVAFASKVRDERVGAAVILSGARGDFGGAWFPAGSPALLAVHGDADGVNPFSSSQSLYRGDLSGSPRQLVRVLGGGHTDAFTSARTRPALVVLVDDFLRASLGTEPAAADRIAADASVPGVLELLTGAATEPAPEPTPLDSLTPGLFDEE